MKRKGPVKLVEVLCFKQGEIPVDIHADVCSFLYGGCYNDLQRHLNCIDRTTLYAFRKNENIVGAIKCIWKRDSGTLPLEEAFSQGKKLKVGKNAVEVGGFKLELPVNERIELMSKIFHMVIRETTGNRLYLTCDSKMEKLYKRKFGFSTICPVTFDHKNWFVAMERI